VTAKVFNKLFSTKPRVTAGLVLSQQTESLAQTFVKNIEFSQEIKFKKVVEILKKDPSRPW
jgi:hypothetical protein